MSYKALLQSVVHGKKNIRESPKPAFLDELIKWGRAAPDEIFEPRGYDNIYLAESTVLGPYRDNAHRRAVMLEVMRVLGGFESSWNWKEGVDKHPQKEKKTPMTSEAGLWQISANSMNLAQELKDLAKARIGTTTDGLKFQQVMKADHNFAMEYTARLLRNTIQHNGPTRRHALEIDHYVRLDAVQEFLDILYPKGSDLTFYRGHWIVPFVPIEEGGF